QSTRVAELRNHRVLSAEPVADINDDTAGWQFGRRRFHQPTASLLGLVLGARAFPQAEIQPARCDGQEAIRSDALVDPRDRVPALLEHLADVTHMLAGPSGHPTTLHRMYAYSVVLAAEYAYRSRAEFQLGDLRQLRHGSTAPEHEPAGERTK